jgi:hypothetical protein
MRGRGRLKSDPLPDENTDMPLPLPVILALTFLTASATPPPLPRGSDDFRLGMSRAQVDSAVAARKLPVVSSGGVFLVCGSDDPAIEYEHYAFFQAPHGMTFLWRVTIGYRLEASREDLDMVLGDMQRRLGEPASDTGRETRPGTAAGAPPPLAARQVIWADPFTAVQLGGRWSEQPDRAADRMMVTWTDRRLQRLVEARRKKGKGEGTEQPK